ncbi:DUF2283 domain-containing protein [Paenibacillus sp. FSL E2-8871]|uniref:DUF2283 domain-containing protein n=1 Tax=Paenibacillus sp. FSL E2-8871 TaxID=2975326 RepID=UPI0030FC5A77
MPENKIRYDDEHDVMYVFFGRPQMGSEEEVAPGIYLRISDETEEIIGIVITDFKSRTKKDYLALPFSIDLTSIFPENNSKHIQ